MFHFSSQGLRRSRREITNGHSCISKHPEGGALGSCPSVFASKSAGEDAPCNTRPKHRSCTIAARKTSSIEACTGKVSAFAKSLIDRRPLGMLYDVVSFCVADAAHIAAVSGSQGRRQDIGGSRELDLPPRDDDPNA